MTWQAGDIGASTGTAFVNRLIQTGQKLKGDPGYRWNHIFVVVSDQGDTIEARAKGVVSFNLAHHAGPLLNLGCPEGVDRQKVVEAAHGYLGTEYGYFDDFLLGLDCLTHLKLSWRGDTLICSELGNLCLRAGGWKTDLVPSLTMPADLVDALQPSAK